MFRKKTQSVIDTAENPIQEKLQSALNQISAKITNFKDGHYWVVKDKESDWYQNVTLAQQLLAHPGLVSDSAKDGAQRLLESSLDHYYAFKKEARIAREFLAQMESYQHEISEALLKLGPIASTDELQQRLMALGSPNVPGTATGLVKTEVSREKEIYAGIRPTLFAVDALISLKEDGKVS